MFRLWLPKRSELRRGLLAASSVWLTLLGCSSPSDVPTEDLRRLAATEPENLAQFEDGVRRYFRGLQTDLGRRLDDGAEASELAEAAGRLGWWYHVHLFYPDARTAYALAESLAPDDAAWPYVSGHAARSLGESAAARRAWRRTVERRPDYLPAHLQLAELALAEGDLDRARAALEKAESLAPNHPRILVARAEIALEEDRHEDARNLLTKVVEKRPDSRRARYGLGLAHRGLGDVRQAQRLLTLASRGVDKDPTLGLDDPYLAKVGQSDTSSLKVWRRGRAALDAGRPEDAIGLFEKALEAAPGRVDFRVDLGTALGAAGRTEEALTAYRQALADQPDHDGARIAIATIHTREKRFAEAEQEYRRVLEHRPNHPAAHLRLAHLLRLAADLPAALGHYGTAVELDPRSESARFWGAWTYHLAGDTARALKTLEDGLAVLPGRPMLLALKARLGSRAGASSAEIAVAGQIAAQLFERRSNAFYAETLAMTLAAAGRFDEAIRYQQTALTAARAAQAADTSVMEERLERYRSRRRADLLLAPQDTDSIGIALDPS